MLHAVVFIGGVVLVVLILIDAFRTVVLARRVGRTFHVNRSFYELTWTPTVWITRRIKNGLTREQSLGIYGPLSFLLLLLVWAAGLIVGYGVQQWASGLKLDGRTVSFAHSIYFSAWMLFTVGASEPEAAISRWLKVLEAGMGLSFLFGTAHNGGSSSRLCAPVYGHRLSADPSSDFLDAGRANRDAG